MSRARATDRPAIWRVGSGSPPDGPHLALVPGAEAPLLRVDLPDRLRGLARERVAVRQLTEALALPKTAAELHPFAPQGKMAAFGGLVVVEMSTARGWREALRPGCIAVLPDYLALPCIPQVWTVETGGDGVSVRLGETDGFTAEHGLALRLLAAAGTPRAVLRLGPPESSLDDFLAGLDAPVFDTPQALASSGAGKPVRWSAAAGGVDLSAAPSALYDRLGVALARWRWPVLAASAALAAYLGSVVLETGHLREEAVRAAEHTRGLVRQHFVPEGPILNIRAQVQAAADASAQPATVASEVPALIQLQRAAPILARDGLTLQSAEYRADTGLVTALSAPDFASLDALVAELRADGYLVEVLDSRSQSAGGVAARLRLQEEPRG